MYGGVGGLRPSNHKAHLTRFKETQAPEVLTVNGKAEVVVQDATSYQLMVDRLMVDRLHHMETLAAIREGMASAKRGELKSAARCLTRCGPRMAYRVSLAAPAEADAYAAFERIREAAPVHAEKWFTGLFKAIFSLDKLPARCSVIPEAKERGYACFPRCHHRRRCGGVTMPDFIAYYRGEANCSSICIWIPALQTPPITRRHARG